MDPGEKIKKSESCQKNQKQLKKPKSLSKIVSRFIQFSGHKPLFFLQKKGERVISRKLKTEKSDDNCLIELSVSKNR